jgi:hypothetical protein
VRALASIDVIIQDYEMIELRTEVANLKKELVAKKKEVKDLTAERDAALKKKPGPGATAKESKELVDLRGQVLQGSAREKVLREQLDALHKLLAAGGSAVTSPQASVADPTTLTKAMELAQPNYSGLASLLAAARVAPEGLHTSSRN